MTLSALAVEDFTPAVAEYSYGPQPVERRRAERHRLYETHWLTMSSTTAGLASFLVARLVDISECGVGLCTLERVEPGHEYAIAGEVQIDGEWMEISAQARVVRCRPSADDMYAVGLETFGLSCRNIPKPQ